MGGAIRVLANILLKERAEDLAESAKKLEELTELLEEKVKGSVASITDV